MANVKIYSKDYCPYCTKVKNFFESKQVEFEEIDVTEKPETMADLIARTNLRTVPQVFIGEQFVGGCNDVLALDAEGKLDELLSIGR